MEEDGRKQTDLPAPNSQVQVTLEIHFISTAKVNSFLCIRKMCKAIFGKKNPTGLLAKKEEFTYWSCLSIVPNLLQLRKREKERG